MQKSYCYTPGVRVSVGVSVRVRVHMQNVRVNVKVMEIESLCIFSCILTLLIILIKPLTTKAYDRRASGDCGTSGLDSLDAFNVQKQGDLLNWMFKKKTTWNLCWYGIFEPMFIYCVLRSARIFSNNGFGIYRSLASCVQLWRWLIGCGLNLDWVWNNLKPVHDYEMIYIHTLLPASRTTVHV